MESPKISAEMLVVLAFVEARRVTRDSPSWCRKNFVGKARRLLGREMPENVVPLSVIDGEAYFAPQRDAQAVLRALCVRCKGCEMAEE